MDSGSTSAKPVTAKNEDQCSFVMSPLSVSPPSHEAQHAERHEPEHCAAQYTALLRGAVARARGDVAIATLLVEVLQQRVDLVRVVHEVDERRVVGHVFLVDVLLPGHLVLE